MELRFQLKKKDFFIIKKIRETPWRKRKGRTSKSTRESLTTNKKSGCSIWFSRGTARTYITRYTTTVFLFQMFSHLSFTLGQLNILSLRALPWPHQSVQAWSYQRLGQGQCSPPCLQCQHRHHVWSAEGQPKIAIITQESAIQVIHIYLQRISENN